VADISASPQILTLLPSPILKHRFDLGLGVLGADYSIKFNGKEGGVYDENGVRVRTLRPKGSELSVVPATINSVTLLNQTHYNKASSPPMYAKFKVNQRYINPR
jgi:hypothetical protein